MRRYERIICLTEESVETLYELGCEDLIVGVSAFVKRPKEACSKPTVSTFTHAHREKILKLNPDLVLGFSDIQKDIARDLIGEGVNVWISNHRSLNEILTYIETLARMVGAGPSQLESLLARIEEKRVLAQNFCASLKKRPRVYFEEWDSPQISGIQWVSELIELCGGDDVMKHRSKSSLAKDRVCSQEEVISANPEIIIGCWCGKKVNLDAISQRPGHNEMKAVREGHLYEVDPAVFLQPGPAPFLSGIDQLLDLFQRWAK